MANTFVEKAQKYMTVLDEIYQTTSLTAMLEQPGTEYVGNGKVRVPKIDVSGAADYDRVKGYVEGAVTAEFEEHTLEFDRGRKFRIDYIDNDEMAFDLYRQVANQYVRTKEIPEVDAARFARMAGNAYAHKVAADINEETDALAAWDECEEFLTDMEVDMSDVILYVSTAFYRRMKASPKLMAKIDANSNNGTVNRGIKMLDDQTPIYVVPKPRFYTAIELLTGEDGTAGGYKPIDGTSKAINFMAIPMSECKAVTKRNAQKVIMPDVNQQADAYDIMYRCHHGIIVPDNKAKGIYVHHAATAYTA